MNKYYCPKCNEVVEGEHNLIEKEYDLSSGRLYLNVEIIKCKECKTSLDHLEEE